MITKQPFYITRTQERRFLMKYPLSWTAGILFHFVSFHENKIHIHFFIFILFFFKKKKGNISFWASIWIVTTLIIRASICAVCSKTISIEKPLKRSRITSESLVHHQAPILTISHKWSTITWNVHPSISQIRSPILAASNEFSSCCSLN